MIGYRFLSVAEEEMSEAAMFYEAASFGLGRDFLDDLSKLSIPCGNILRSEFK